MKRIITLIISAILLVTLFAGCDTALNNEKIKVITTVFPIYDWTENIIGKNNNNIELTMLLDTGVDLHSFQPTAKDILTISDCDVFIYVGGESDEWVEDALKEAHNKDMITLNLMEIIGENALSEELKEGMQDEEHDHDDEEEHDEELDEHIWLSLKNAKIATTAIAEALGEKDADNKENYKKGADEYIEKIDNLDSLYSEAVNNADYKTLVIADRFPFAYMFRDYGLDYYAAFKGCSAETEASFETIIFLANKVDELGLKSIIKIETSDGAIAKTVKNNTKQKNAEIVSLNSLQSITEKEKSEGADYLKIMTDNLNTLKKVIYK
ncbi:MAG: zinc ABC transporter substrate-binding protein [Clostridia bacterium]|nr:zinc ABC transporter substrate-binding protein [Clostridia bacterium]